MTHILYDTQTNRITWRGSEPYSVPGGPPLPAYLLSLEQIDDPAPDYDPRKQRATRTAWTVDGTAYRRGWTLTDYTVAEIRERLTAQVDSMARDKRDSVTAGTSPAEMSSWSLKRQESLAYTTEPANQSEADSMGVGLIYAEAQARGVSAGNIAARVLTNAASLSALEAGIAGNAGRLNDALTAAETVDYLLAVDLDAGWPI